MYSGPTNYTIESNNTVMFIAPDKKGVYLIEFTSSLDYSCKKKPEHLLADYTNVVAYIIVE